MLCCLNPECDNPSVPDQNKYCPNCGFPLVILRYRYRPLKSLRIGELGKTYLAEDIGKVSGKCVIKQYTPRTQAIGALQRAAGLLKQEAEQLEHLGEYPQIPKVLAYFTASNRLYLVQEFIDGENLLAELGKQGKFNEQKIRELLLDLLPVLELVHQAQVIHQNIKPENIVRHRSDGKLFLIDFGISKQLHETVRPLTLIGSFGYAALEQMQDRQVYPATDLYGLGATCFHLLTGIHPWDLYVEDGYGWVREWRKYLQKSVSPQLGIILDKLLHKDYQQRYQSAIEVLQALQPLPLTASYTPQPVSLNRKNITRATLITTLTSRSSWATSVAIGPDSNTLVSGSSDNTIKVWNLGIEKLKYTLTGHSNWVLCLALSPDGNTLVSGSSDNTIKIWNLVKEELKYTLNGHSRGVLTVAISADSNTLVSGSSDKTIKVWNLVTGELKSILTGHSYWVESVAISPDGDTLVSGSGDKTIKIWSLGTGELKSTLTGHSDLVTSVLISADNSTLVSGSNDKTIKIWNLGARELQSTFNSHSDSVTSLAISPDSNTLVSGSNDKTIKIWNLGTRELQSTLTGHSDRVLSLAISADNTTLVSASRDSTIKIWRLRC